MVNPNIHHDVFLASRLTPALVAGSLTYELGNLNGVPCLPSLNNARRLMLRPDHLFVDYEAAAKADRPSPKR